jgi:competence protein ComEA
MSPDSLGGTNLAIPPSPGQEKDASVPVFNENREGGTMKEKRRVLICFVAFCLLLTVTSLSGFPNTADAVEKGQVNINTASVEELTQLPRVGAKVAERIVDYRKEHGSFKTVEDLKTVKGIGDKMLEQLRPQISVK